MSGADARETPTASARRRSSSRLPFGTKTIHARGYVSRFNFRGVDQEKKVGELSGGQRNRVQLAKLLRRGANVIMLDEPTNDLDLAALRVLEDAFSDFAGTLMIVSHDRWFLDRVATNILAFEGDGRVRAAAGRRRPPARRSGEGRRGSCLRRTEAQLPSRRLVT